MTTAKEQASPPEDSLEIRISCAGMSMLSVCLAFHYMHPSPIIIAVCLSTVIVGSFVSYYCRATKNRWLVAFAILGTVMIMGNYIHEISLQYRIGRLNPLIPFVAALTQLQSLHCLDLRTKSDTNTSFLLGLTLLGFTALLGQDLIFALTLLLYLPFAAFFLYRQSVDFTIEPSCKNKDAGKQAAQSKSPLNFLHSAKQRRSLGSTVLTIASLPACTLLLSLTIPHIESTIDGFTSALLARILPGDLKTGSGFMPWSIQRTLPLKDNNSKQPAPNRSSARTLADAPPENSKPLNKLSAKAQEPGSPLRTGLEDKGSMASNRQLPSDSELKKTTKGKTTKSVHRSSSKIKDEEELSLLSAGKKKFLEDNQLLLTIKSSRSVFLKRQTFDYFDGINWYLEDETYSKVKEFDCNPEYFTSLPAPADNQSADRSVGVSEEITANADIGHYIPVAWRPVQIAFPAEKISIDGAGNLKCKTSLTRGLSYRLLSNVPVYSLADLRSNSDDFASMLAARQLYQSDLELPDNLAGKASVLARTIAGNETSWFSQAAKICKYLQDNFKYSLTCQDECSEGPVNDFLFVSKTGDCTRFASAFVVLCRSLRIPARCVSGFAPGEPNLASGLIEVRAAQSHAWGEVFLPKVGWLPFDAVPGGYLPDSKPCDTLMNQIPGNQFSQQLASLRTLRQRLGNKLSLDSYLKQTDARSSLMDRFKTWLQTGDNRLIILAFTALGVLLLYFLGRTYLVAYKGETPRASTVIFLRVMKSLRKIQVKRQSDDTAEDVMAKVLIRLEQIGKPKWRNDLPAFLVSFFDSYILSRFNESESPATIAELKEKSRKIEKLLASAR